MKQRTWVALTLFGLFFAAFPFAAIADQGFSRNLSVGMVGDDVKALQVFLNNNGFPIAESGVGSKGNESTLFGNLTKQALIRFQEQNSATILAPYGLSSGTGNFYTATRTFVNGRATTGTAAPQQNTSTSATANASASPTALPVFTRDLTVGMVGDDVKALQVFLNNNGFPIAESGVGSKGNEGTYFGTLTQVALAKFQEDHRSEILAPAGLQSGTGNFLTTTRAVVNAHIDTSTGALPTSDCMQGVRFSTTTGSPCPTGGSRAVATTTLATATAGTPVAVTGTISAGTLGSQPTAITSGGSGSGGSNSNAPTITSVSMSPTTISLNINTQTQFAATVAGTGNFNNDVQWTTSRGTISTTGLYTAPTTAGTDTVTVTSKHNQGVFATATITVVAPVQTSTITSVVVSAPATTVNTGAQAQFSVVVNGAGSFNNSVTWSALRGTISPSSLYTAPTTSGADTITATSVQNANVSGSATINVVVPVGLPTITSVSVSPTTASVNTGAQTQFNATVNGTGSFATGVTWSATRGTISSSGLYTAPGTAGVDTVTARSVGDTTKSASASVTVTTVVVPPTITAVTVTPISATVNTGAQVQFTAGVSGTGSFNNAVTWSASRGTISAAGLYTAPASAGGDTVTAVSVQDATKTASANVTVSLPAPTISSVVVSPTTASVNTGTQTQFTATVTGTGAFSVGVTWTATRGTVTSSGLYTAPTTAGSDTVTTRSTQDTTKSASATVTVSVPVVTPTITAVTVAPTTATVNTGAQTQFTATVTGTGAFSTGVTWTALNGSITSSGLYTAPAIAGTDTVTARSTQDTLKSGAANVTVNAASAAPVISNVAVSAVTTTGATIAWSLSKYGTGQLNYGPTTAYGTLSSPENSLSYNAHSQILTGLTPGTLYHFSIRSCDGVNFTGNCTTSTDYTFTTAASASTITGVTVSPASVSVNTGAQTQFTSTVAGTGAFSTGVTWTATRGTVSSAGLYTAPATAGSDTITARSTQDTTKSASATVTVSVPVVGALNVKNAPYNAKGDGVTDDTAAIQSAINAVSANGTVFIPDGTYMINAVTNGIHLKSNMTLNLSAGAVLKAKTNSVDTYAIILARAVTNVTINGTGTIQGERATHTGSSGGEWGMGIQIDGASQNVHVDGVTTKDCFGDGIYIAGATTVTVNNIVSDNNRRQALSLVGGDTITITNSVFKNTNGTPPAFGIDVEPNAGSPVSNVLIQGNTFTNNTGGGVSIGGADTVTSVTLNSNTFSGNGNFTFVNGYNVPAGINVAGNSVGVNLTNNTITGNYYNGIFTASWTPLPSGIVISGNTITGTRIQPGLSNLITASSDGSGCTPGGSCFMNAGTGITLGNPNATVSGNTITGNAGRGIDASKAYPSVPAASIFSSNISNSNSFPSLPSTYNLDASTVISVTVAPATASVNTGAQTQFTATVSGTGAFSTGVTWTATRGTITSSGLYTAPSSAGSDTVTATSVQDGTKATTASVTVNAVVVAHTWDVTISPPVLTAPTTIVLDGTNYQNTSSTTFSDGTTCTGPAYVVNLSADNTKDYIIKSSVVLREPVQIYGGRNVRVVGLQIDLSTAACGSMGASGYIPGAIALRMYQAGSVYVEGAYIDLAGRSADCIDPRNFIGGFEALSKGYTEAAARGTNDVVIQNTVCRGMSGDVNVHGDILQTQGGYELYRNVSFENVTADSNCEGVVLEPRQGYYLADNVKFRRFDYQKDARYAPNPVATGGFYDGGPIQVSGKTYSYDQTYIYRSEPPYQYAPATATTFTTSRATCNAGGVFCPATPATNRFASPGTAAATDAWTGLNYVSPFGL